MASDKFVADIEATLDNNVLTDDIQELVIEHDFEMKALLEVMLRE